MIPKVLAPGGDISSVKAAILAGADEVYLGVSEFNARRRAENITFEDLEELVRLARQREAKLFLTLNTLVLNDEFDKIADVINRAVSAGISAFIVQDLGLLYILHDLLPEMEIHGSTQLTTHNHGQIDFLAEKGISRINLARELSIEDIAALTEHAHGKKMETEVFVHGAYCISYSGQCYMSSMTGGKSGNRGICFQPCRRLYSSSDSSDSRYRLNLKDNNQLTNAGKLSGAGVDSLKIEGRIKGFPYVYTVTDAWKKRLQSQSSTSDVTRVFNRGFHAGYLENRIEAEMFAPGGSTDQSLEFVSEVASYNAQKRMLQTKSSASVSERDQIFIYTKDNRFICTGTIREILSQKEFLFQIEHELKGRILKDQMIFKNPDLPEQKDLQERISRLSFERQLISVRVSGCLGAPLKTLWKAGEKTVAVESSMCLEKAKSAGMTSSSLEKPFSRLDSKFFKMGSIDTDDLESHLFLPVSELNRIRREAASTLFSQPAATISRPELPTKTEISAENHGPYLFAVNTVNDYELLLKQGICADSILFEAGSPGQYDHRLPCMPWFPAIIHESVLSDYYSLVDRITADLPIFTDNLAIAHYAHQTGRKWIAGSRLNIVNSFAVRSLKESGASGFVLSQELNRSQIESVLDHSVLPSYNLLFGPLFLMETQQCLVRGDKGCKKPKKDEQCFTHCRFSTSMYDEKRNRFFLEKRPYKENEVYNGAYLYIPETLKDLKSYGTGFIVDMRRFAFFNPPEPQFNSIIRGLLHNRSINKSDFDFQFTRGNYNRGLS